MKHYELPKEIQRSGHAPLYLIQGEEDYLRDQALRTIRHTLFGSGCNRPGEEVAGSEAPFACEVLYGDETDSREILERVEEIPIFSSHQLVVVKWVDKLSAKQGESLIPYLESPAKTATVVFEARKLDGRQKWVQSLKRKARVVDCPMLFDSQWVGWIKQEARQLGLRLQDSAAQVLKDCAPGGLYAVKQELEKLACYVPAGQAITHQDVEAVRGTQPGASVFDLAGALAFGHHGEALNIIAKNLESGEAPLRILGALVWQFRRIGKARELLDEGMPEAHVAKATGIPPFRQREFFALVRGVSLDQVRHAFRVFEQTDSALKGGAAGSSQRMLEDMILSFAPIRLGL